MLGLGNSLVSSSKMRPLFASYTSDFTLSADGWQKASDIPIPTHNGTPTVLHNQGTGDAADGTGWLKIVYGADQTSGLFLGSMEKQWLGGSGYNVNDLYKINFKIKIIHDGVNDHWGGTDDVTVRYSAAQGHSKEIPLNTTTTVSQEQVVTSAGGLRVTFGFSTTGDRPTTGATWYLKDYSIQLFR